jgi:hypothetical protein
MGWYYSDNDEPVPQHLQPKGQWLYKDTNEPVPHDLVPGNVPFPPGWRGQTMREMVSSIPSPPSPTIHGIFDAPDPGTLNPTAQRVEDYLMRKGAPIEQALPGWAQPIVHPLVQPATPTEAAVTGVGALGLGGQAVMSGLGQPELVPPIRWGTQAAQLATALAGGALEARSGHRIESAENEAIKTALGLVLAHTLHLPYIRALGKPLAPLLRVFAPAVGRVGTPAVVTKGPEAVRSVMERLNPAPAIMEGGGGEGGGEGGESSAP